MWIAGGQVLEAWSRFLPATAMGKALELIAEKDPVAIQWDQKTIQGPAAALEGTKPMIQQGQKLTSASLISLTASIYLWPRPSIVFS